MSKRAILGYLFTLGVIIFCFSAVYSFNYSRLREEKQEQFLRESREAESREQLEALNHQIGAETPETAINGENSENRYNTDRQEQPGRWPTEESDEDLLAAEADKVLRTNPAMLYVVGQFDWTTGIITETVSKFPKELLGLIHQELLAYLHDHPEYGTLLSFSEYAVFLRKNSEADWAEYSYYLILEEKGLMVYYPDRITLYLETGIQAEDLSAANQELLKKGFYIKDIPDLFDYLQNVTS